MANQITLTDEQLAKVITVGIVGCYTGAMGLNLDDQQITGIYEETLSSIRKETPGEISFVEEFIDLYDNLPQLKASAREVFLENNV